MGSYCTTQKRNRIMKEGPINDALKNFLNAMHNFEIDDESKHKPVDLFRKCYKELDPKKKLCEGIKTVTPYSHCMDGLEIKDLIEIEQCGKKVLRKFGIELKDDHKFSTSDKVSIGILAVSMAVTIALVLYVLFAPPRP